MLKVAQNYFSPECMLFYHQTTVNAYAQAKSARTNPSYYYKLAKIVSKAITRPGQENPLVILTAFPCEFSVAECTQHKGAYKEPKAKGGRGNPIEICECNLIVGRS